MGVFNKTPYTNFHELNLNWIIKKIKEVAADNTFLKQFFKTIEDEHILGVVTKVTENNDNTVKTDYLNADTQQMDDYTVYNKAGTDGAISGAVSPIATRVTSAEGRLDDAEDRLDSAETDINTLSTTAMFRYVNLGSQSIIDFIHDTANTIGAYILNVQSSPDNPAGSNNTCSVVLYKRTANGQYSYLFAFRPGKMWICTSSITASTTTLTWKELLHQNAAIETLDLSVSNVDSHLSNVTISGRRYGKLVEITIGFTASSFPLNTTYQLLINNYPRPAGGQYVRARSLSGYHSIDAYIGPDGAAGFRCLDSAALTAASNFSGFNFIYLAE